MSASAPNLFDILLHTYDELGQLVNGVATGGSSTTLVDSGLAGKDGDWKQGTLFIKYDGAGAGAAPEGEFTEVTAYTRTAGTVTFASSALSASPASTDEYALASKQWTLDDMKRIVNRALVRMGDIQAVDTSLTTAAGQTEYTIPAAARRNLRRVYMDQYSDSDDARPRELVNWRVEGNSLIFRDQPESGKTLTLLYMGPHAVLQDYNDTLSTYVHLNRIVAEAAYMALKSKVRATEGTDRQAVRDINDAAADLEIARRQYPIWDPGTPFKPILSGKRDEDRRSGKYGPYYQG